MIAVRVNGLTTYLPVNLRTLLSTFQRSPLMPVPENRRAVPTGPG